MKIAVSVMTAAFALVGLSISVKAQDKDKPIEHNNVRTIKGCLDKTDSAKEFKLMGTDGSTWEIKSDSVNLAKYIGHTVSVTGVVSNAGMHGAKEDAKNEAKEHGIDKGATEHGHLTVTNLKMVSDSCSTSFRDRCVESLRRYIEHGERTCKLLARTEFPVPQDLHTLMLGHRVAESAARATYQAAWKSFFDALTNGALGS